ncbi:hypothetical protein SAMN02745941_02607 [Clostridium intestinale DSM 6191]|uniref:Uncharacterized protein n=1 Tax=Clostridium intestinale DSM 6191 TaxID=1121320 RepID=A0A1M5Z5A6_9CLOT|nr:hypothetical protein SAMN02745941_02607 [Clostridium intestinale DSM 6191]
MSKVKKYGLILITLGVIAAISYIVKEDNNVPLAATKDVIYKKLDSNEVKSEQLKESNIKKNYDIETAKKDMSLIFLTDSGEYINKNKIDDFFKQMENKNQIKIRYTQYAGEFLDKMRDVEFDGEKIILKEYDTKSPEGENYFYIEIAGEKIDVIDGYYKLLDDKGEKIKLFPQ